MMIASVSDPHVGNFPRFGGAYTSGINARCQLALSSLAQAVEIANIRECDMLVVNGDLFDTDSPSPQVVTAVIAVLRRFLGRRGVHIILGNHDQNSMSEGDHALGPLEGHVTHGSQYEDIVEITVYEKPAVTTLGEHKILFAPYNVRPVGEWLPGLLELQKPDIVFAHFGIIDSNTPEFLLGSGADAHDHAALLRMMESNDVSLLCVGNWHDPGSWHSKRARIEQIGALTPTGFDNLGPDFGHVLIIDTDAKLKSMCSSPTVTGPRFVKFVWGSIDNMRKHLEPYGSHIYASVEAEPEELAVARAWLKTSGAREGIQDFTLAPNKTHATNKARAAAASAALGATMRMALNAYVSKMPLAETVDRDAVSKRVLKYLKSVGGLSE